MASDFEDDAHQRSAMHRTFQILRTMAEQQHQGVRVTYLAKTLGMTPATTHRLLQGLTQEGMVEQDQQNKLYRLSLDLFCLAAQAGTVNDLRAVARPALLRLNASLGDTVLLLVRSGFDAVCLDRVEGQYPIRTFTGDVGGRIELGVGQGAMVILAHLPEAEQEEVLRYNLPRIRHYSVYDEVYLRSEVRKAREQGYSAKTDGLLEGMAGIAVPVFDRPRHRNECSRHVGECTIDDGTRSTHPPGLVLDLCLRHVGHLRRVDVGGSRLRGIDGFGWLGGNGSGQAHGENSRSWIGNNACADRYSGTAA